MKIEKLDDESYLITETVKEINDKYRDMGMSPPIFILNPFYNENEFNIVTRMTKKELKLKMKGRL